MPGGKEGLLTEGRAIDRNIVSRLRLIVDRIWQPPEGLLEAYANELAGLNPWGNLYSTKGLDEAQQAEELKERQDKKREWMEAMADIGVAPDKNVALAILIGKYYDLFAGELRKLDSNLEKLGLGPDIPTPTDEDKQLD